MERLTIYLDRVFAGGEIRDSQNVVVYRMESAYDPLAARRGPGMPGVRQEEGLTGLGRKIGGWVGSVARNRAIVRDMLTNTGFVLEIAVPVSRGDLHNGDLTKIYKVKKIGPFEGYVGPEGGILPGSIPVKVSDLGGNLLAWGRCPSGQWVKRRYLLQSKDGETVMETKRESWLKPVFSLHRSSTGEQIGWLRQPWYWFLIPNARVILFVLAALIIMPFVVLVSPAFLFALFLLFPLLYGGLGLTVFRPLLARSFAGRHKYQLEFWGNERERLQALFLSLSIGRMRAEAKGGRR